MRDSLRCRRALICFEDGSVHGGTPDEGVAPEHWPAPGTVVVIPDTGASDQPLAAAFPDAEFVAAVPITRDRTVAGMLCVTDAAPRPHDPELVGLLTRFGHVASLHLQRGADADLFRVVAENSADTLIRGSLDGVRRYVSPSIRTLLGYEAHELVGLRARDNVHPDDLDEFAAQMAALGDGRIDTFTTEHRQRHKDGYWVWLEAFVQVTCDEATGERDGYVVSVRDTSRRKEFETQLVHNAFHDVLTGLPNRALLYERLAQEIDGGGEFAVLCLDLDGFKAVNDELGHAVGDSVLVSVGERLLSCVDRPDMVARRGGDEFVIIHVPDRAVSASAEALAQRLIDAVASPLAIAGWSGTIGLSIGIAVVSGSSRDGEAVLRAADEAMYSVKAAGRNGYRTAGTGEVPDGRRRPVGDT
ncbi:hypothetical protein BST22_04920 [Mycolicibacterium chubuense]|uniref:Cyclic di-GMP phosphodiesterase Gmr n=1 Tax=Mycolicibacterium chubuense TaxID=1800 RepID=A0A0J6WEP9_MYCCU|nr:sensor domain-containing diguanylate cyclase [Mycolicibacterium chubuense]KMO80242.1 Cyclic di-GMP phosphodiesterase Gmr [Mycolicibacterium chubuense]ORA54757.1 hypothetical protein BST22_04920 [Mycolicibacterium chubuense]SPY45672.1 PAS domain S-box/diguanylate cyclase (GGDEF) domain-containing protein [Mycolicibacterium chubuense]